MNKVTKIFELFFILSVFFGESRAVPQIPSVSLNNGEKIPAIGYGTWMAKDENALITALEAGYRYIDTAYNYENEKLIGRVLKRWISEGKLKREDLFILTKLPPTGNRPERVSKYLKRSLENLQLDYVDMYLIHVPFGFNEKGDALFPLASDNKTIDMDSSTNLVSVWKEMERQVTAGLTKSIGLSNFNKSQVQRILENSWIKPSALQIELHIELQQKELVDFCKKNDILVIAYSPFGSPEFQKFVEKFNTNAPSRSNFPNLLEDPTVEAIATKYSKTTPQILLRFYIQSGVVPIPKSVNSSRIRMNIDVFDFQLDDQDMDKLKALDKNKRIIKFSEIFLGIEKHPEYPFNQN